MAVPLLMAVVLTTGAYGQQLYAGPGTVIQGRVKGPFVQEVNPYGLPGSQSYRPFPPPRVYVPAPGPFLYDPVIIPPAYGYAPYAYPPSLVNPYNRAPQPYQGYQPRSSAPRFADPYATPAPQTKLPETGLKSAPSQNPGKTTKPQSPTSLKSAESDKKPISRAQQNRAARDRARALKDAKTQAPSVSPDPNKPAGPAREPATESRSGNP